MGCYDGGNNDWIVTENKHGEWYMGYHGVKNTSSIYRICHEGFRKGPSQQEKYSKNTNPLTKILHPTCEESAYFAQNINDAVSYASYIYYKSNNYKIVFMCRINPYSVRICDKGYERDYMIKDGNYNTKNEARPYRILVKKEICYI